MAHARSTILVADDGVLDSESGRRRSLRVREQVSVLAKILGLYVESAHAEDFGSLPKVIRSENLAAKKAKLSSTYEGASSGSVTLRTKVTFLDGRPTEAILKYLKRNRKIRWLAVGTRGHTGLAKVLLGSVSEELIRNSKLPVLVMTPKSVEGASVSAFQKIVVATTLSRATARAEKTALELAKKSKGSVVFVHCLAQDLHPVLQTALSTPSGVAQLSDLIDKLKRQAEKGLKARVKAANAKKIQAQYVLDDRNLTAVQSIVGTASSTHADVVVTGTRARSALTQAFLGSTARETILNAPVPVIVVP